MPTQLWKDDTAREKNSDHKQKESEPHHPNCEAFEPLEWIALWVITIPVASTAGCRDRRSTPLHRPRGPRVDGRVNVPSLIDRVMQIRIFAHPVPSPRKSSCHVFPSLAEQLRGPGSGVSGGLDVAATEVRTSINNSCVDGDGVAARGETKLKSRGRLPTATTVGPQPFRTPLWRAGAPPREPLPSRGPTRPGSCCSPAG
jgi:hypothetical protein